MTRAPEIIEKLLVVLVAATLAALVSSCATLEQVHNLDDRVRLLECKEINRTLREILHEQTPYPAARDEARDYDERTIEHDQIKLAKDERAIEHDERTIEHDERAIEHDERTIEHDERTIEHDERTIEHDEVFRKLVACRKDTVDLQIRLQKCVRDFAICMNSENCGDTCETLYDACVAEERGGSASEGQQ